MGRFASEDGGPSPGWTSLMSQTPIEAIRIDVACPACQYNLRGLPGAVVTCPECGATCDVARLVARRWTGPWHKAPGFAQVLLPGCWLYTGIVVSPCVLATIGRPSGLAVALPTVLLVIGGGFVGLLWWVHRWWGAREGVFLALLPVALIFGYVGSIFGLIACVVRFLTANGSGTRPLALVIAVALGAVIYLCRRGEKFIAHRCIKRYLARPFVSDSLGAD